MKPSNRDDRALRPAARRWLRLAPLLAIVALIALAYFLGLHHKLSFETLIRHREAIDEFIGGHGWIAVAGFMTLYAVTVGLSLPGAVVLTVVSGFLFGPVIGSVVACVGALAGATLVFLVARTAAGEILTRRCGPFAARLSSGFRADAFNYLLFLRLVPLFPFWLVNLAPAVLGVRLATFVAATAIGILPGTITFAVFGAGLGSVMAVQEQQYNACVAAGRSDCRVEFDLSHVFTPTLLAALAGVGILALVPVIARRFLGRRIDGSATGRH